MPRLFITTIVLFLLLSAGYGLSQAARYIPWDCADWQAFAHEDRTTAILESLAENRGKTLYCGIDQSDTFGKAETWAAGKDRNERDGTVYWGEGGSFRGFIAAQEGWLTEGESGITGQSIAHIFEFPKEERRRTKRVKRLAIGTTDSITSPYSCGAVLGLICSDFGARSGSYAQTNTADPQREARYNAAGIGGSNTNWEVDWRTQEVYRRSNGGQTRTNTGNLATPNADQWQELAKSAARRACRARGYPMAVSVAIGPGHSLSNGSANPQAADYTGTGLGWFFNQITSGANHRYEVRQSRTWRATCKKIIRRTR